MSSSDASAAGNIRVICGPTGSGKSAIAMWLAGRHRCAIISADSRQIYRAFDVGTSKPSPADRESVVHFGIDVAGPTTRYSAAAWSSAATGWIASAIETGRTPVIVGGTGMYLRALFEGLFAEPDLDAQRRGALASVLVRTETEELRRWVSHLDPRRARFGRTQLLRAIEVALLAGARITDLHAAPRPGIHWRPCYLVVDPEEAMGAGNVRRTEAMFASGWVEEVRELLTRVPADAPAWKSVGYAAVGQHVRCEISEAEARERVIVETRQYVKRQRTWFRHQLPESGTWRVNPAHEGWERQVERWWSATENEGP